MNHNYLPKLPFYYESPCCGYVAEKPLEDSRCKGCGTKGNTLYNWFPDSAYEYAILIEDYHNRELSELRKQYFEEIHQENWYEYWTSNTKPVFGPTTDWKPVTILLFRSLYELLLDHCLWKLIRVQLLPTSRADDYASFILNQFPTVSAKRERCYHFITGNRWKADVDRLGYKELDNLLKETASVRNEFVHENPLAGHTKMALADKARECVPTLFEFFVTIANEYHHPYAKHLSKIKIIEPEEE